MRAQSKDNLQPYINLDLLLVLRLRASTCIRHSAQREDRL